MRSTDARTTPAQRSPPRGCTAKVLAAGLAFLTIVSMTPVATAQDEGSRPATCVVEQPGEDAPAGSGVTATAQDAPPQRSTGAVLLDWDPLPDARRADADGEVAYDVHRVRLDAPPAGGEATRPVPITEETFLASAGAATEFLDTTGLQGAVYAWAVVARGAVVDADPETCPGQAIRVFHADELDDEPETGLPQACDATAEALADGRIRLTWTPAGGDYAVYRGLAEGDRLTRTARVSGGETYAEDLIPGVTYAFLVTVWGPETQEDVARCDMLEVTAVPYFGSPAIATLAGLGAVGAVVMMRRRSGA